MKQGKLAQLVLLAGIVTSALFSTRAVAAQPEPQKIQVTAKRFAFTPGEITVKKGQPVILVIRSTDADHGLKFKELNLDVKAPKNRSTELRFTPDKTGDFVGHCSVFCGAGHGSMTLTLHVVE